MHNGECVSQNKPICSGWYNYSLPEDAKQNPSRYMYNLILDNIYEEFEGEVPAEVEWRYVDNSEWNENISCSWTCADGYHINSNYTECVKKPKCNVDNKSNIRNKQKFCDVWNAENIELKWEPMGWNAYAPFWSYDCVLQSEFTHCSKYPTYVTIFNPTNYGSAIKDMIETHVVNSSKLSSIRYLFNSQGHCAIPDWKPRWAADFPHNIQKTIGTDITRQDIVWSFTNPLEFCGWLKSSLPAGWTKSELDYLVIPDWTSDIWLVIAGIDGP